MSHDTTQAFTDVFSGVTFPVDDAPCIFRRDSFIIQKKEVSSSEPSKPFSQWNTTSQFFSINPFKATKEKRQIGNCASFSNFLFECDEVLDATKTVNLSPYHQRCTSLELQYALFLAKQSIISMATYSGRESIHFIVQLENPPADSAQYRFVHQLLRDEFFPKADKQCKDCVRLSRTPNAVRVPYKADEASGPPVTQQLIHNTLSAINYPWENLWAHRAPMKSSTKGFTGETSGSQDALGFDFIIGPPLTRDALSAEALAILAGKFPPHERDRCITTGLPQLFRAGVSKQEVMKNIRPEHDPKTIERYWEKLCAKRTADTNGLF